MMVYHLGPFYFHTVTLDRDAPLIQRGSTQETSYPYRIGKALVLRLGRTGLVCGLWVGMAESEDLAMIMAVGGRVDDDMFEDDGTLAERFERHLARQNIAKVADDLDEEWRITDDLGLMYTTEEDEEDAYEDGED